MHDGIKSEILVSKPDKVCMSFLETTRKCGGKLKLITGTEGCHLHGWEDLVTLTFVLPKLSCGLNFFAEIDNLILKITWKVKGPRMASTALKRVKFEDSQCPGNTATA